MAGPSAEQRVAIPTFGSGWLTLTFVHWPVPPAEVQALLPPGLVVDQWQGSAWVSLTPFVMADLRPFGLGAPAVAARRISGRLARLVHEASSIPETNLRTYVRGPDGRDGLWFLSLDIASRTLAVALRGLSGAPYRYGRLNLERNEDAITYAGSRPHGESSYRMVVRTGDHLEPSDLDLWLTSRWRAYTTHLDQLLVFPVEHEPWPLQAARLDMIEQDLTDAVGLPELGEPALVHFSEGVRRVRMGFPRLAAPPRATGP
jgi:uncharacterized protein